MTCFYDFYSIVVNSVHLVQGERNEDGIIFCTVLASLIFFPVQSFAYNNIHTFIVSSIII